MSASDGAIVSLTKIVDNGPASSRYNLVIVAEGYRDTELTQFEQDARDLVDRLFATAPFSEFEMRCRMNVYRLNVRSTDSGGDNPSSGSCGGDGSTARTYFDATFCAGGLPRLLGIDYGLAETTLNAQLPEWDSAVVIVNSTIYGGSGGARIAVTSKNGDWRNIAIHELGHSAFNLADEYEYWSGCGLDTDRNNHPATEPGEANVTIDSNRATNKWRDLVAATTAMPTTSNADCTMCDPQANPVPAGTIGTFEGAHYYHCGAFRPAFDCMMRNYAAFCAVCRRRIREVITAAAGPVTIAVTLATPTINFNDVPAGSTTVRAAVFDINLCASLRFEIISGPTVTSGPPGTNFGTPLGLSFTSTSPPNPRQAQVWISYTGTNNGDNATGTVTVRCVEMNQTFVIPITANTVNALTVASVMVLDQSGSMDWASGIPGQQRIDVLKTAAPIFVRLMRNNDGVGTVRFDHNAYPGVPVQPAGIPDFGAGRVAAVSAIATHATNPAGGTSIGDGVALANSTLTPVTGFDRKAIVVFTDGDETAAQYITDVASLINDRVYAIGLGTADQLRPLALSRLVNNTGGYLMLTGALGPSDIFRLQKYFLQVLAGVTNASIVVDPDGAALPGVVHRIPFLLTETDINVDVILLSPAPWAFKFMLEAPDGSLIDQGMIPGIPDAVFSTGDQMHFYRMNLPVPVGRGGREGIWHAVLSVNADDYKEYLSTLRKNQRALRTAAHGVPYSVSAHTQSDLHLRGSVLQDSMEPGATLTIRAVLTEYGLPVERRASVQATLERPDGTRTLLLLSEIEAGVFETTTAATLAGIYRIQLRATGLTLRGNPFTREQSLTAAVWRGGNGTPPSGGDDPREHDRQLCNLLACLLNSGSVVDYLKRNGIDPGEIAKCIDVFCQSRTQERPDG